PQRSRAQEIRSAIKTKPFALDSAIYEIIAWNMLSYGLQGEEIERKYAGGKFPDVLELIVGDIIRRYWDK
ncbi:hypothetical protein B0O99DRAFT_529005, partial [Bisporella sp. PMI_857]